MEWWGWIVFGFLLLIGELLTPGGFFLLFFGLGGILVGLIRLIGLGEAIWVQWLLFTLTSVGMLVLLRARFLSLFAVSGSADDRDNLVGEIAIASTEVGVNATGHAQMRGTVWNIRNVGAGAIVAGGKCVVRRVVGLVLEVEREG